MNIRRDVGRARNEWQFIRIDRSLVRYENKSISSQITAFGRPLCRSSTGECHLTGYLVCTNTLCSIIRSLYAAVSVLSRNRSLHALWSGQLFFRCLSSIRQWPLLRCTLQRCKAALSPSVDALNLVGGVYSINQRVESRCLHALFNILAKTVCTVFFFEVL